MTSQFRPAIVSFLLLTVVTGVLYPALVTGIAKLAFARQAEGNIIEAGGKAVGSTLIGQSFDAPRYFWSRPSATSPAPYSANAGSGSNQGPTNPALADAIKARIAALKAADPANTAPMPVDLVTASASGLDPHISVAAALYQVPRIARERKMTEDDVRKLVQQHTTGRTLGVLGEPVVNVLLLNLALDGNGSH